MPLVSWSLYVCCVSYHGLCSPLQLMKSDRHATGAWLVLNLVTLLELACSPFQQVLAVVAEYRSPGNRRPALRSSSRRSHNRFPAEAAAGLPPASGWTLLHRLLPHLSRRRARPVSSDAHTIAQQDHRLLTRDGFFDTERSQTRRTRSHRWVLREVQTHSWPCILLSLFSAHLLAISLRIAWVFAFVRV